MPDFRDNISRHSRFDHEYNWQFFVRNTKLPRDTFKPSKSIDGVVFIVCVILLTCALFIVRNT